jgi:microcompartment protein CcmK/EutM
MMLARVIGRVWATAKEPNLEGRKLLLVQPITPDGTSKGKPQVAVDAVGAGAGEIVYWCRGRESSLAFDPPGVVPCDASVVGIVDIITRT